MVGTKAYKEKYMYGIEYVKNMIEAYDRRCVQMHGCTPIQMVDFRIKSAESVANKLKRKGYEISCKNATCYLSDLAGVRVVCFSEEDIYELEDYLCTRSSISIIRKKDYIKAPKENGYRSLHLIAEVDYPAEEEKVRVEIQLRTQAMHCWAEADHKLCYKK